MSRNLRGFRIVTRITLKWPALMFSDNPGQLSCLRFSFASEHKALEALGHALFWIAVKELELSYHNGFRV